MSSSPVDQVFYAEEAAREADKQVAWFEAKSGLDVFNRVAFDGSEEELPPITVSDWKQWLKLRIEAADNWVTALGLNPFANPGAYRQALKVQAALKWQLESENFPDFLVPEKLLTKVGSKRSRPTK
jgi:hypothetical protein